MSIADLKKSATNRMQKSADTLKDALSKLRTGRANTAMLDHLRVEYYGNMVPLNQVANVALGDSRTQTLSGAYLMDEGVTVRLGGDYDSTSVLLERLDN